MIVTGYSDLATNLYAMALGIEIINKPLSAEMIEKSVKESFVVSAKAYQKNQEAALGRQENSVKTQSSSPPSVMDLFLFMIAPVIGLGYVIAVFCWGRGVKLYLCAKSVLSAPRSVKMVFGLLMGPLVGLAFVVLLPFAGLVGLGYEGVEVLKKRIIKVKKLIKALEVLGDSLRVLLRCLKEEEGKNCKSDSIFIFSIICRGVVIVCF